MSRPTLILSASLKENLLEVHLQAPEDLVSGVAVKDLPEETQNLTNIFAQSIEWLKMEAKKKNNSIIIRINSKIVLTENRNC